MSTPLAHLELTPRADADADADARAARDDGVDLTLIDEMLRLDPGERLRLNDRAVNAVLELRRAFDAAN